jgi:hypothetical protein
MLQRSKSVRYVDKLTQCVLSDLSKVIPMFLKMAHPFELRTVFARPFFTCVYFAMFTRQFNTYTGYTVKVSVE